LKRSRPGVENLKCRMDVADLGWFTLPERFARNEQADGRSVLVLHPQPIDGRQPLPPQLGAPILAEETIRRKIDFRSILKGPRQSPAGDILTVSEFGQGERRIKNLGYLGMRIGATVANTRLPGTAAPMVATSRRCDERANTTLSLSGNIAM
jgi:hypothetical protein